MKQPEQQIYSVTELHPFHPITREEYKNMTGTDAPPFDPSKPRKRWVDLAAPKDKKTKYNIVKIKNGVPVIDVLWEHGAEVNLPGAAQYPSYQPAPTSAVWDCAATNDEPAKPKPINPADLSDLSEAQTLMKELGGTNLRESASTQAAGPCTLNWNGETRRMYEIQVNGQWHNVGLLLKLKNAEGVGRPGNWSIAAGAGSIAWIPVFPSDLGLQDPRPEVPFPVRPLYSNEKLVLRFGGQVMVERTDLTPDSSSDINTRLAALEQRVSRLEAAQKAG